MKKLLALLPIVLILSCTPSEKKTEDYKIPVNLLVNGNNTLAVEVHNHSASSSDMSSNVFLFLGVTDSVKITLIHLIGL